MEDDMSFGQIAVNKLMITEEELDDSIEELYERKSRGEEISLGDLLVEKGLLSSEDVREILSEQDKEILTCSECGIRYNIMNFTDGITYYCKECREELSYPGDDNDHRFDRTAGQSAAELHEYDPQELIERRERTFREIAVYKDYVTEEQIENAVEEAEGEDLKLWEYCLREGLLHPEQIREIFEEQNNSIVVCPECQSTFNVEDYSPDDTYNCDDCGKDLIVASGEVLVQLAE